MQWLQTVNLVLSSIGFIFIIYLIMKLLKVQDPRWVAISEAGELVDKEDKARVFSLSADEGKTIPHSPNNTSVDKYIDYVACGMRFQTETSRLIAYKLNQLVEIDTANQKILEDILRKT